MLSRGYWIGESMDELAALSAQVQARSKLGLTDLNIFVEDFFRDLLNKIEPYHLVNANQERSNFPGIDLIDKTQRIAIQVTATRTSEKINETLRVFSEKYSTDYDRLIVLIVGQKQTSYTLNSDLVSKARFNESLDLWDITTLTHKIVDLSIDLLQEAYQVIKKNIVRVKIELETPDEDGKYPTSTFTHLEATPNGVVGNVTTFLAHCQSRAGSSVTFTRADLDDYKASIEKVIEKLKRLPRTSREFVAILLQEKLLDDDRRGSREENVIVSLASIERKMRTFDVKEEVQFLEDAGIVEIMCGGLNSC